MCARRFLLLVIASFGLAIFLGGSVAVAALSNLSYAYPTAATIAEDSLVSINAKRQVVASNTSNESQLVGITVTPSSSLLAAASSSGTVQVAVNGIADVLVSTLNGAVGQGDHVSVSQINGVGMKARPGSRIIGTAQATFNSKSVGAVSRSIKLTNGRTETVSVGYVHVSIAIGTETGNGVSGAVSSTQQFVSSLVGHPVSTLSIIVSGIVAVVALIAVITLIYSSVRGEMVSIGRNPLAKQMIFESLAQVMAMAALITVLAVITIYLTLH